jgi:hypothetical protein
MTQTMQSHARARDRNDAIYDALFQQINQISGSARDCKMNTSKS